MSDTSKAMQRLRRRLRVLEEDAKALGEATRARLRDGGKQVRACEERLEATRDALLVDIGAMLAEVAKTGVVP